MDGTQSMTICDPDITANGYLKKPSLSVDLPVDVVLRYLRYNPFYLLRYLLSQP